MVYISILSQLASSLDFIYLFIRMSVLNVYSYKKKSNALEMNPLSPEVTEIIPENSEKHERSEKRDKPIKR